jgi:hypothetical protein
LAAVALAVVSTKDPEHFRPTLGGYFHGMVQKAKAGELHLERTVWALRRAGRPEQRHEARQGRATALTSSDENAENISLLPDFGDSPGPYIMGGGESKNHALKYSTSARPAVVSKCKREVGREGLTRSRFILSTDLRKFYVMGNYVTLSAPE